MTHPTKCPKCGSRISYSGATMVWFACESSMEWNGRDFSQTDDCKLRVVTRKYRREKARLDALAERCDPGTDQLWADYASGEMTLRQLADELIAAKKK